MSVEIVVIVGDVEILVVMSVEIVVIMGDVEILVVMSVGIVIMIERYIKIVEIIEDV
jgi:hypothetical protein